MPFITATKSLSLVAVQEDVPQPPNSSNCKVEGAVVDNSTSKGNNSLGMTLDDIMNMYRLKGNNHNDNRSSIIKKSSQTF